MTADLKRTEDIQPCHLLLHLMEFTLTAVLSNMITLLLPILADREK